MQKKQKPRAIPICENCRDSFATESKPTLFTARQTNESQRQSWGKEKDFILKAGRLRRRQTSVSK